MNRFPPVRSRHIPSAHKPLKAHCSLPLASFKGMASNGRMVLIGKHGPYKSLLSERNCSLFRTRARTRTWAGLERDRDVPHPPHQ